MSLPRCQRQLIIFISVLQIIQIIYLSYNLNLNPKMFDLDLNIFFFQSALTVCIIVKHFDVP